MGHASNSISVCSHAYFKPLRDALPGIRSNRCLWHIAQTAVLYASWFAGISENQDHPGSLFFPQNHEPPVCIFAEPRKRLHHEERNLVPGPGNCLERSRVEYQGNRGILCLVMKKERLREGDSRGESRRSSNFYSTFGGCVVAIHCQGYVIRFYSLLSIHWLGWTMSKVYIHRVEKVCHNIHTYSWRTIPSATISEERTFEK